MSTNELQWFGLGDPDADERAVFDASATVLDSLLGLMAELDLSDIRPESADCYGGPPGGQS
ncbi:MAG: hypothetical protein EOO27_27600 [Comamonadaceae bacterium]|nr:MAG: hypothetical protein EOO27_27600 [Comamonadaceae bacterium]